MWCGVSIILANNTYFPSIFINISTPIPIFSQSQSVTATNFIFTLVEFYTNLCIIFIFPHAFGIHSFFNLFIKHLPFKQVPFPLIT